MKPLIILLLCLTGLFNALAQTKEVVVRIDPGKTFQHIDGFGASDAWRCQFVGKNWPLEKREAIADLLFSREFDENGNPKGIGLSIWRFYLSAGTAEQGDSSGIGNIWRRGEVFQNPDGSYDWSKHQGQRWFLEAARNRGVEKFLAFTIAAPVHMSANGKGFSAKGNTCFNIAAGKMDDYAAYLVDVVDHFQKEGYNFEYLSPFNEPQWNWDGGSQEGAAAQNEELYTFIKYLSHQLDQRNMPTKLVVGEAGTIGHLFKTMNDDGRDNQIPFFFSPDSPFYIGALPNVLHTISGHSYFSVWPVEDQVKYRKELAGCIKKTNGALGYWQTEYCILEKNDEIGQGGKRDLGMSTALFVARIIHNDLTLANAKSWQWWTALTQFDYKDGLIYLNSHDGGMGANIESLQRDGQFHDSKLLWAFGAYSRFIRPGMIRIEAGNLTYPDPAMASRNVMVSAYRDPDTQKIVVVAINVSGEDKKLSIEGLKNSGWIGYLTSDNANLEKRKLNGKRMIIPSRSIMTLLSE